MGIGVRFLMTDRQARKSDEELFVQFSAWQTESKMPSFANLLNPFVFIWPQSLFGCYKAFPLPSPPQRSAASPVHQTGFHNIDYQPSLLQVGWHGY